MTINSLAKMTDNDTQIKVAVCTQVFPYQWIYLERDQYGYWEDEELFNQYKSTKVTKINPRHDTEIVEDHLVYSDYLEVVAFTKDAFNR